MAAFPTLAALGWLRRAESADALAGPGLLRPGPADCSRGSSSWQAGLGRRSGSAVDPWPRQLEGWLACRANRLSTAGSIPSSATTCRFRSRWQRALGAGATDRSPPASGGGSWAGSGNSVIHCLDPQGPGVQPGPPPLKWGGGKPLGGGPGGQKPGVCTPRPPPANRCPWQGHLRCYAAAIPLLTREKRPTETLPFSVDWRGRGCWMPAAGG